MRALGEELRQKWGQPLIIENRPGGSMNLGTRACAESAPGRLHHLHHQRRRDALQPVPVQEAAVRSREEPAADHQRVPPDPHAGGELASSASRTSTSSCALSKAKAGTLSYLAPGAPLVLYMETLKKEKGADWVRVPFRGGGEAVNAILSGTTPIALFGEGNVIGNIRAGQMTPLVMMNNIRSPNFPEVPLLAETGYNGPPSRSWYGIFAPAGTPKAIVDKVVEGHRRDHRQAGLPRPPSDRAKPRAGGQHAGAVRRGDQARARGRREGRQGRRLRAAVGSSSSRTWVASVSPAREPAEMPTCAGRRDASVPSALFAELARREVALNRAAA